MYKNTYIYDKVILVPSQLNNKLYKNLKNNVIRKLEKKNFKDFGYVEKVHSVNIISNIIEKEDNSSNISVFVEVFCNLCNPIKDGDITFEFEIIKIKRNFIVLKRGPMKAIIFLQKPVLYDNKIFFLDTVDNTFKARIDNNESRVLKKGDLINFNINYTRMEPNSNIIYVSGVMKSLVIKK